MYLAPDGEEIQVADGAATFLSEALAIGRLHRTNSADLDEECRLLLGDMGWFGLAIPESDGGSGLSAVEQALFSREVGRQCGPLDILAQSLAAMAVRDADLRADLASGRKGVSLLVADAQQFRLLGSPLATFALYVTPDDARLFQVDALKLDSRPALDPANSMHVVAVLPTEYVNHIEGASIWQMGQLSCAAMLVGIAEHALDVMVAYAKIRETFGRKIGCYQAVRHPCAEMALRAEAARAQLWFAAAAIKEGRPDAGAHLDAAKHLANLAAVANSDVNIQLHGGIGVTDEHVAHLLLKHALVISRLFGAKRALLKKLLHAKVES